MNVNRSGATQNIRGTLQAGALLCVLMLGVAPEVFGQDHPSWTAYADGERLALTISDPASPDEAARRTLAILNTQGYLAAAVDSAVVNGDEGVLYLSRGSLTTVDELVIEGMTTLDVDVLKSGLQIQAGRALDTEALEGDLTSILRSLERAGRPLASAEVSSISRTGNGAIVVISIDEGEVHPLRGIEFVPEARTDVEFAARLAGLRPGLPFERYDPASIRSELEASGLFESVGQPDLAVDEDGFMIVRVPVEEAQPGAVDLVLGYLPPSAPGEAGSLIGSGGLVLRNLFGRGRRMSLELIRNPGLVSSVDIRVADPYVLGMPLRLEGRFSGHQQDSTYARQVFGIEAGYRVAPGLEAIVTGSRESVEAGIGGTTMVDGRQRVTAADAWFAGVGARFSRVDRPFNPRRGLVLETLLEQGVKQRSLPEGSEELVRIRQQRLRAAGRLFAPTFSRQAAVIGADAAVILGEIFDDSDLFRLGGATSLRGYDEDQFGGNVVARGLVEYRYLLDPTSFAFVFFDLGYVHRPETPGAAQAEHVLPGYGIGLQYRTPVGLVIASYALNPDEGPTRGKFHLGLSIGL